MATTYIKLGPLGDLFNSDILGIYLNADNSVEIDEQLIDTRLKSFIQTGFLVIISKVEHDNLTLKLSNARNIPLNVIPIERTISIEPVLSVVRLPPANLFPGNRFLVWKSPEGPWAGKEDYIAEFTGTGWVFTKPFDKLSIPVYEWGISVKYQGTYPSGFWSYDEDTIAELDSTLSENLRDEAYALELFTKEAKDRADADKALQELITNFISSYTTNVKASAVQLDDTENYYSSTQVEGALKEVALILRAQGKSIADIITAFNNLSNNQNIFSSPGGAIVVDTTVPGRIALSVDFQVVKDAILPIQTTPGTFTKVTVDDRGFVTGGDYAVPADIVGLLDPTSQQIANQWIPPLAIVQTFVRNSQAAMLALVAQEGDVCVRTDLSKTFILTGTNDPTILGNWQEMLSPTAGVTSITLAMPVADFTITNPTITNSGTISVAWANQTQNKVLAAPVSSTGIPTFRALTGGDIPNIDWSKITSGKPTTLAGYGIIDALSLATGDARYAFIGGSNASGTWGINITGNAATATLASNTTRWNTLELNLSGLATSIGYTMVYDGTNNRQGIASAAQMKTFMGLGNIAGENVDKFHRYNTFTADANTVPENTSNFSYALNAPYAGYLGHFGNAGYGMQLNTDYGGVTQLALRTRNGDANSWNTWYQIWTSAQFTPSVSAVGNSVVQRDGSGYILNTYINTTDDVNSNPSSLGYLVGKFPNDNYHRSFTVGAVRGWLGLGDLAYLNNSNIDLQYVTNRGNVTTTGIGITRENSGHDPYGPMSVCRGTSSDYSYYGMTRAGQVGWGIGIDTSNRLILGTGSNASTNFTLGSVPHAFDASGNASHSGRVSANDYTSASWYYTTGQAGIYSNTYFNGLRPKSPSTWDLYTDSASVIGLTLSTVGNAVQGYLYAESTGDIGLLGPDGNWALRINSSKQIYASSNINSSGHVRSANWLYSTGNTGWYNETYGGGINMYDSTYIRTYGSKTFYCDRDIIAASNLIAQSGQVISETGGFKSTNYRGLVGDYDTNTTADKMIWTIGDGWNTVATHYGIGYAYTNGPYTGSHQIVFRFNGAITSAINLASGAAYFAGYITAAGGGGTSDIRHKNVKDKIELDLTWLDKDRTFAFTWKTKPDKNLHYGYSAQEINDWAPELVFKHNPKEFSLNQTELLILELKRVKQRLSELEAKI